MSARGGPFARLEELPKTLPVFPLTGALLLPGGQLPLNIFEPRYLAMIDDALGTRDRLIGMIQPREPGSEGMTRGGVVPPSPPLYRTGCAGRLTSFRETEDRRYLIVLDGICRFEIGEELATPRGYRRVVPEFTPWWQGDMTGDAPGATVGAFDRDRLVRGLRAYFAARNVSTDWNAISETPDERLVTTLAMLCPFSPQEKQALLEARTTADRARAMTALLEMALAGQNGDLPKH